MKYKVENITQPGECGFSYLSVKPYDYMIKTPRKTTKNISENYTVQKEESKKWDYPITNYPPNNDTSLTLCVPNKMS
jgi:hypothetical protein